MSIIKFSIADVEKATEKALNLPDSKSYENDLSTATGITAEVRQLILQFDGLRREYLSKQNELRSNYSDEFVSILQQLNDLGVDYTKIKEIDLDVVKLAIFKENPGVDV